MPDEFPTIYVIAGCNGAGKTTFATEFLPHAVHCLRFLNPDEIARGLSPLDPPAAAVKAGRILLTEIRATIKARQTFALESTLSGRGYIRMLKSARDRGFQIEIHYLWIASPAEAIARVKQRVRNGGHYVSPADIRRRFKRSLQFLVSSYLPLANRWAIWDNRTAPARQIANSSTHSLNGVNLLIRRA
jgi:predicted ABC-type ATPase